MLIATPAQASTSVGGCTVTPRLPVSAGYHNSNDVKMIRYSAQVSCNAGRTAVVNWQGVEEDWSSFLDPDYDDTIFATTRSYFFATNATRTYFIDYALPDTESGAEEVYLKVRFKVTCDGLETPRTNWERTPYVSMTN
jgi:hypothetical protein